MTNFDFLFGEKKFSSFSGAAAAAEKIFGIDAAACAVNARRAAELAVKWLYEHDRSLPETQRDQLAALTGASEFRALVGNAQIRGLDYIRRVGNNAAHNPDSVTRDQARLALKHLYDFVLFIAERHGTVRPPAEYDRSLLDPEAELVTEAYSQEDIRRLLAENRALKRLVSSLRHEKAEEETDTARAPLSEADTRRLYVETALAYAGWQPGTDCFTEYPIQGLPGKSGVGYADYALCGDKGTVLAIVEAQSVGEDPAQGRQQAKLYADALEKKTGIRPVIFLTNGAEIRVWFDESNPERPISGFYSRSDLLRIRELRNSVREPRQADWNALQLERPYHWEAVRAVWDSFCKKSRRSALLSMAPGTGKTRTALSAAELLRLCGRVQNVLYLAENELLTAQAYKEQLALFPRRRAGMLSETRTAGDCEILFSTFADLLAEADSLTDKRGNPVLSAGRFDLILCDEADISIFRRYTEVFSAFDAPLLILSSVSEEEGLRPLYDVFGMETDGAAYRYTYEQAVREGYLSAAEIHDLRTELLTHGLRRDSLDAAEQKRYDSLFDREIENVPASIRPAELLTEYFNADTLRLALEYLRTHGRRRNGHLAKTLIFTASHAHSEWIYHQWGTLFPEDPPHFCRVADSSVNYVRSLIDDFSQTDRMPQVVLSHDLLLDGVNLPAVENLVFLIRVPSRNVFWRMLGRGMRRCPSLPDGKPSFFVLDLCGDYAAFGGDDPRIFRERMPVWSRNFAAQVRLAGELQSLALSESCAPLRQTLVRALHRRLSQLNRENFSVRRHLPLLDRFSELSAFDTLAPRDIAALTEQIAPILPPDGTPEQAALFSETMYALMTARACRKEYSEERAEVMQIVRALSRMGTNRKIAAQKKLLNRILFNGYLDNASLGELETVRRTLEPLIRYLEQKPQPEQIAFSDRILSINITGETRHHESEP